MKKNRCMVTGFMRLLCLIHLKLSYCYSPAFGACYNDFKFCQNSSVYVRARARATLADFIH